MEKLSNPQVTIETIKKYDFAFQKKFGQNFLIDSHVLDKIIAAAGVTKEDVVLEIGPGFGTMTQYLAEAAKEVIAVEIDKTLIPILHETLADYDNVVHLFIYGDEDVKVKRIMERYSLTEAKAKDMIIKKDKQRQSYYNYYSSKKWGRADSYDLCINSSVLGVEGTVKLITQYIEDFEKKNN